MVSRRPRLATTVRQQIDPGPAGVSALVQYRDFHGARVEFAADTRNLHGEQVSVCAC